MVCGCGEVVEWGGVGGHSLGTGEGNGGCWRMVVVVSGAAGEGGRGGGG